MKTAAGKVVLFVLGVTFLAWVASLLLRPPMPKPDEANRVSAGAAFSVVKPPEWGVTAQTEPDVDTGEIVIAFNSPRGAQYMMIEVRRRPKPFDQPEGSAEEVTFQDKPARLFAKPSGRDTRHQLYFERGAWFYRIDALIPANLSLMNGPYRPYLDTFRDGTQAAP